MKKMIASALALLLALTALALPASADLYQELDLQTGADYYERFKDDKISINVYNWGEYISDGADDSLDVNEAFTQLTGITVNYSTFATNEELYAKLKSGGADYDVIIPSDYMISRMIGEDMLEALDLQNIPNYRFMDPTFLENTYDPTAAYSVPYTWGTVGIIYNTAMVDGEVDSWDILWNEKYAKNILMFGNPRDAFGISLARLGYSLNTTDENELKAAAEELKAQKELVQAYVMDEIFDKMQGGEAALAPYYAGDAITMIDVNPDLAFAIPKEGTNIFSDAMCIPKGAAQKEAAELYINFLCEPAVAAANIEYIGYSTPNLGAYELLDDELKNSPIAYPPEAVLQNTEEFISLPDATNELMDSLWTEILSNDSDFLRWVMPIGLVVAIIAAFAIITLRRRRKAREQLY